MVESYLAAVANPGSAAVRDTPILRSLRGSLKKADLKEYRRHLAIKFRFSVRNEPEAPPYNSSSHVLPCAASPKMWCASSATMRNPALL